MGKLPFIGITTYGRDEKGQFYLPGEYVDAVRRALGVPLMLAPGEKDIESIVEVVDGLIFAGGGDFDPKIYGGAPHPSISRIDAERDAFEMALAKQVMHEKLPVLGICRGFQLLNIATGGDLVPDVPEKFGDEVTHRQADGGEIEHFVGVQPDSRLSALFNNGRVAVMSKHHQALNMIADCWAVVAKSPDGVIEGLEHKSHPWMVAVLWHPELSPNDVNQNKLFEEFVSAARSFRDEIKR